MRGLLFVVGLVCILATSSVASAQPSAAQLETARGLFREGVTAGDEGRWTAALDLFERAHALTGRADVLLNVAAAQVELGRLVAAAATYRRFQAEADAAMIEQHGAAVASALADLEERTARVAVRIDPPGAPGCAVMLDGQPLAPATLGSDVPVDAGDHIAALLRGGAMLDAESFTLAERERREIVLTGAIMTASATGAARPQPADEAEHVFDAPSPPRRGDDTLAIVLGVAFGVVVVGTAVALGVVLGVPNEAASYRGNVSPYSIDID